MHEARPDPIVPYDEAKYLMALKAKGSPLVAELAK
jgi:hypothetical protein